MSSLAGGGEQNWSDALSLGNDGCWRQRLRIAVQNDADRPLAGEPVELAIGQAPGQADLAGAAADALRLVDDAGTEMLWAVRDAAGTAVRRGPISAGSVLVLPAECSPHGRAGYWLYFDNPAAWAVPDFLDAPTGLGNGDMEQGDGAAPAGWQHDPGDAGHTASWVAESPHSGRRCLKTVVAPGRVHVDRHAPVAHPHHGRSTLPVERLGQGGRRRGLRRLVRPRGHREEPDARWAAAARRRRHL